MLTCIMFCSHSGKDRAIAKFQEDLASQYKNHVRFGMDNDRPAVAFDTDYISPSQAQRMAMGYGITLLDSCISQDILLHNDANKRSGNHSMSQPPKWFVDHSDNVLDYYYGKRSKPLIPSANPSATKLTNEQVEDILLNDDLLTVPVKDTKPSEEVVSVPIRHQSKLP